MADRVAIWREALQDRQHPRHRLAWVLFPKTMPVSAAARRLEAHKDEVIGYLLEVLETPALFGRDALGEGHAPGHAMALLGYWRVTAAVPRLLQILDEQPWSSPLHDQALKALEVMGPSIIDEVLAFAETARLTTHGSIASVLVSVGQGDARAFNWVKDSLLRQKSELDFAYTARLLLDMNPGAAIPFLEKRLRDRRYSAKVRRAVEAAIARARRPPGSAPA